MPVSVLIPEPWGRNPGGAEGGGELLAAFCCTALMALGGLVLLFWMLTFSLTLPRLRAGAGSAFSSADFGDDAQGWAPSYRLVPFAISACMHGSQCMYEDTDSPRVEGRRRNDNRATQQGQLPCSSNPRQADAMPDRTHSSTVGSATAG